MWKTITSFDDLKPGDKITEKYTGLIFTICKTTTYTKSCLPSNTFLCQEKPSGKISSFGKVSVDYYLVWENEVKIDDETKVIDLGKE